MPYIRSIVYIKEKKEDLNDFEHGLVVWAGLSISETPDLLGVPRTNISRFTENGPKKRTYPVSCRFVEEKNLVDVRGQRRIGRLVTDNRKATSTQITARGI